MHCMKCGRNVEGSHVFCSYCMAEMEQYPIKPGTVVRLPQHYSTPLDKKRQQKNRPFRKNADQITMLRNRTRWLTAALIVTLLCFLAAAFFAMWLLEWHKYIDFSLPSLAVRCIKCFT